LLICMFLLFCADAYYVYKAVTLNDFVETSYLTEAR